MGGLQTQPYTTLHSTASPLLHYLPSLAPTALQYAGYLFHGWSINPACIQQLQIVLVTQVVLVTCYTLHTTLHYYTTVYHICTHIAAPRCTTHCTTPPPHCHKSTSKPHNARFYCFCEWCVHSKPTTVYNVRRNGCEGSVGS